MNTQQLTEAIWWQNKRLDKLKQRRAAKLGSRGNNVSRLQKMHRKEHRQVKDSIFFKKRW